MANWPTHTIIADLLLQRGLPLCKTPFVIGNIAPDCNIENEDWTAYEPPREMTHFMTGESKLTADAEAFFAQYCSDGAKDDPDRFSFLLGYYAHLITDVEFMLFLRDSSRLHAAFRRLSADPALQSAAAGQPKTFRTLKNALGKARFPAEIAYHESRYLAQHPDASYFTVLLPVDRFPDYLDFLPPGAIARKISVMVRPLPPQEEMISPVLFTHDEYCAFLDRTSELLLRRISQKMQ
ncbi:MAG: zinc dependent phospholipase C family protein [Clostridia bacterium]|nr:zinc dependent phospholipase C family protein [Clostridia bacterium]